MTDRAELISVKLERFKAAFKPQPVEIRKMTVLIGRNSSGKSTLLEALQWVDATLRRDAVEACRRYFGVHDLLNLRSQALPAYFVIKTQWRAQGRVWDYEIRVDEDSDQITPRITIEKLASGTRAGRRVEIEAPESTDRLALWKPASDAAKDIRNYWRDAVFLRLSPNRLAQGSLAKRTSSDPLLDEEGQNLPALLNELNDDQREHLVELVSSILRDIKEISVSGSGGNRSEMVHYMLHEQMPYQGRSGRKRFPIPAWMLSEGTRRITAIMALLAHEPRPSLLCIEEIENGLDPWTVIKVLEHLTSAAERGTQVILTTHSPWLLDHVDLRDIVDVSRQQGTTTYQRFADIQEIKAYQEQVPAGTRYVQELSIRT